MTEKELITPTVDPKFTSRPIIHGNLSRYFKCGKRPGDNHTHQWTVYEDIFLKIRAFLPR